MMKMSSRTFLYKRLLLLDTVLFNSKLHIFSGDYRLRPGSLKMSKEPNEPYQCLSTAVVITTIIS